MLARAVTKAWQDSLEAPPPIGRVYHPEADDPPSSIGWSRPEEPLEFIPAVQDDGDSHLEFEAANHRQIIPKRRVVASETPKADGLWRSYEFWMGIVAGAGIVFVIKTILAAIAPFGVYWY